MLVAKRATPSSRFRERCDGSHRRARRMPATVAANTDFPARPRLSRIIVNRCSIRERMKTCWRLCYAEWSRDTIRRSQEGTRSRRPAFRRWTPYSRASGTERSRPRSIGRARAGHVFFGAYCFFRRERVERARDAIVYSRDRRECAESHFAGSCSFDGWRW